MITAQAPGKLYVAGEYAVVETGFPAIIVALDQFVTVTVEATKHFGSIVSEQYQENSLYWQRQGDEMVFDNRDNPFHYILSAIKLTEQYARELDKPLALYKLYIDSQLDAKDGKKYGLGSSAAVTVANFYDLKMSKDQIYKLAAIAHLDVQGNGSLGDIAASVYGGWIAYRSFDKAWLAAARNQMSLADLINTDWPELSIELLTAPADMQLLVGWTGSPASTSQLVDKITLAKAKKPQLYRDFLTASRETLEKLIDGFRNRSLSSIQAGIRRNRELLDELAHFSGVAIQTPALRQLVELAEQAGAGGGDCGIVLIDSHQAIKPLLAAWRDHHIEPLKFNVHEIND